jgi:hypothetical protein
MFWEESNSASKIVKFAQKQTLELLIQLLLSIFELLLSDLSLDF